MDVHQFRYGRDNLAYALISDDTALVIDGGAVAAITELLAAKGVRRCLLTNTHAHADHTSGNLALGRRCHWLDHRCLVDGEVIAVGRETVTVLRTPGHTDDSVCFLAGDILVTGDTLFNGTVGNCFSGDLEAFFQSLQRLCSLPPTTRIHAGHDYVLDAIGFARRIEPDNPAIDAYLAAYRREYVVSTLADELAVNPFLRFDAPPVAALLERLDLPRSTSFARFSSLYGLE